MLSTLSSTVKNANLNGRKIASIVLWLFIVFFLKSFGEKHRGRAYVILTEIGKSQEKSYIQLMTPRRKRERFRLWMYPKRRIRANLLRAARKTRITRIMPGEISGNLLKTNREEKLLNSPDAHCSTRRNRYAKWKHCVRKGKIRHLSLPPGLVIQ